MTAVEGPNSDLSGHSVRASCDKPVEAWGCLVVEPLSTIDISATVSPIITPPPRLELIRGRCVAEPRSFGFCGHHLLQQDSCGIVFDK